MLSKPRALFILLNTALTLAFGLIWSAESAQAACNPDPPMDNDAVVCDGVDENGYDGSGANGLTLTTNGVTVINDAGVAIDSAILLNDGNDVTIGADAAINVMTVGGFGIRAGDDNTIDNQGMIVLGQDNTVAIGVTDNNTVDNNGTITISVGSDNAFGVRGIDGNTITNLGTMTIDGDNGVALRGNNDNFIDNRGTIIINGLNGRAISLNQNTTGILPNGGVNQGTITLDGIGGIGIEGADNSGLANSRFGLISVNADNSIGISAGDRTDPSLPSNLSNSGLINVIADNAFGIRAGDGWIQGALVGESGASQAAIFTGGSSTINVSGTDSYGIYAGDDLNPLNNTNSFVQNFGTINVTGLDSTAVSLGGNDLVDPFDSQDIAAITISSFVNFGTISGDVDSKPLIEFRSFVVGRQNSVSTVNGGLGQPGRIIASLDDFGDMPDRGIAIRGTAGDEFIVNIGEIRGGIDFLGGDDTYVHTPGAILTDSAFARTVLGGTGNDLATLVDNSFAAESFDVNVLVDFETLEIGGGTFGWELTNAAGFDGLVEIVPGGFLRVPTPISLGGDFLASSTGTVDLSLDGATAAISVDGDANFGGELIVRVDPGVMPGPALIPAIDVVGSVTGQFQLVPISGNQLFRDVYAATGLSIQLVSANSLGVASGTNARAIARHLDEIDALGSTSPALQNLLDEFDTATGTLNNVFRALNPEIYDAQTTAIVDGGRRISNLLFDRPRECQTDELAPWQGPEAKLPCHAHQWSPWLASIGGVRTREEFGDHSRYDTQLAGLVFGIDLRPTEDLDVTFAISSQRGTIDGASHGKSTITLTDLSGHAAWSRGALRVQGAMSWGHGFHKNQRRVRFSEEGVTTVDVRGVSETDSDRITIAAEAGYVLDVGLVKVEPIGGLDWAWVYHRPIHESESFGFGVRIESRDDSIGSINGGVRVSTRYLHSKYLGENLLWMDGVWKPSVDIRWRQNLTGYERELKGRLQGSPDTLSNFTIEGREESGGLEIGTGLSFTPKNANRLQFDLRYEAFLASHAVAHDLTFRASIGF